MSRRIYSNGTGILGGALLAWIVLVISCVAGWITHVVICLKGGMWGFLIAGAIFFPIGIIHGWGHWFGAW